jgi:hypothetical protein
MKIISKQMNLPLRFLLLVTYVVVASALVFLFGGFNTNGPIQSPYIMMSWSVLIYVTLSVSGVPLFLLIFGSYLGVLLCLNNCQRKGTPARLPIVSLVVHSIGIAVCFLVPGRDENAGGFLLNLLSWIIPMIVMLSYFYFDCRLRKRGKRP